MIIPRSFNLQPPGKRTDPAEAELLPHFHRNQEAARVARHDEADGDAEQGVQVPGEAGRRGVHRPKCLSELWWLHSSYRV